MSRSSHVPVAFLITALGCGGNHGSDQGGPPQETSTPTASGLAFVDGPSLVEGGPLAPLSRELHVTLSSAASLQITADDGTEQVHWESPSATEHVLPLVGLHAGGTWTLTVHADDGAGGTADGDPVEFTTPELDFPLPDITVTGDPTRMQPGLTLLPLYGTPAQESLVLVDAEGRIVWVYGPITTKFTAFRLYEDHILALSDYEITELDWMGNVVRLLTARNSTETGTPVECDEFHHELLVTSRGNFLSYTKVGIVIPNFPVSEIDPTARADSNIADDLVLEIDRDSGAIVNQWDAAEIFDPERIGYDSLTTDVTGYNWTHLNSGVEDTVNARWVVSSRHQDAIVAFNQSDSKIAWILANHDNWHGEWQKGLLEPTGTPFEWPYHMHAVSYDPQTSRVMMFDNGNYRTSPWTGVQPMASPDSYSRVVQYTVDEVARTVHQDWEFQLDPYVFSVAMGDADWLDDGHVLADFAFVQWEGGKKMTTYDLGSSVLRVLEFDPATGEVIWSFEASRPRGDLPDAWQAYRAERMIPPFRSDLTPE